MAYTAWSVIQGEVPSQAKWNIINTDLSEFNAGTGIADGAILPNHLMTGASTLNSWVWDSWTPSFTNITVGNGTLTGKYIQIGKIMFWELDFILGNTSAVGAGPYFTLPNTTSYNHNLTRGDQYVQYYDQSAAPYYYLGVISYSNNNRGDFWANTDSSTYTSYNAITNAVPFTWTTSDRISAQGSYEVA